jgi:hypothetical protein
MSTGGPGHEHRFDPVSGWCAWCNLRDDGRLVGKGGDVFHEGAHETQDQPEKESTK